MPFEAPFTENAHVPPTAMSTSVPGSPDFGGSAVVVPVLVVVVVGFVVDVGPDVGGVKVLVGRDVGGVDGVTIVTSGSGVVATALGSVVVVVAGCWTAVGSVPTVTAVGSLSALVPDAAD